MTKNIDPREISEKASEAQFTMGTILDGPAGRDAVHIAMFTARVKGDVIGGSWVRMGEDGYVIKCLSPKTAVGIVDPYIQGTITAGSWVWVFLSPNTISGLRHVWTHPAFEDETLADVPMEAAKEEEPVGVVPSIVDDDEPVAWDDVEAPSNYWKEYPGGLS